MLPFPFPGTIFGFILGTWAVESQVVVVMVVVVVGVGGGEKGNPAFDMLVWTYLSQFFFIVNFFSLEFSFLLAGFEDRCYGFRLFKTQVTPTPSPIC